MITLLSEEPLKGILKNVKTDNIMLPEIETQPKELIKKFQEQKLKEHLEYLNFRSRFYRQMFEKQKIDIAKISRLEDLEQIPVTTKEDIQLHNEDFICVEKRKIIDYITTSGTLGDPVTFAMTDKDLDRLAYNEAISFACAGCNEDDIFQLTTTIDKRFMAGLAYFLGARKLGAGIIRVGAGIPQLQWDSINRMKPTVLIAVPSFILKLIEYAEENGIDYRRSSIKKAICIGEALRKQDFSLSTLAQKIKEKWDLELFSTYASTEMGTAFAECPQGRGGHHHPELIIVELLDENDRVVPEGEPGEVTITTIGVEGMPLLRFKTGDICNAYYEPCGCGRTTMRLGVVIGRKQQMIKFKGTSLYPPSLYDILAEIPGIKNYVIEVYTNDIGTDEILLRVGCEEVPEDFEKTIKDYFRAKIRVSPQVVFDTEENIQKITYPETSRKPQTFIDRRRE